MIEREIAIGTGDAWDEALRAWDGRLAPAEAREAAKRFEALAKRDAKNPNAWAWCARSCYFLGDYESDDARRRSHFERGMKFGQRGLELEGRHPASLFWTSVCEASYIERMGMLRQATYMPEILGYMKRLWEDEPTYYSRGPTRLLGQALVRQPGLVRRFLPVVLPGVDTDTVIRDLRDTIAEDPPIVMVHQTLAQVLHATGGGRDIVREQIEAIEALDPDANPLFALENHLDRPRALDLLRKLR